MRILRLEIENLASFAGRFTVDFAGPRLNDTGLFAITGPTGAGKSTLLDAICLALFAKTPRLSDRGGVALRDSGHDGGDEIPANDARGILRRGAGSGAAQVDFCGADGQCYRARWSVARARARPGGRLQAARHALAAIEPTGAERPTDEDFGHGKREVLQAIEVRLGLSFDQFVRSVLLAQGEFAAFLKEDKEGRGALLQRITGTRIYEEITRLAYDTLNDHRHRLQALEEQAAGLIVATEDERRARHADHTALKTRIAAVDQRRLALERARELTTQLDDAERAAAAAAAAHALAKQALSDAHTTMAGLTVLRRHAAEHRLQKHDDAIRSATAECDGLTARQAEHPDAARLATGWTEHWRPALVRLAESHQESRRADEEHATLEQTRTTTQTALVRAEADCRRAADDYDSTRRALEDTPFDHGAATTQIETHKRLESLRNALHGLRAAHELAATAGSRAQQAQREVEQGAVALATAERDFDAHTATLEQLRRTRDAARAACAEAQARARHHDLRARLVAGEPCVVCGATEHPLAAATEPALAAQLDRAQAELDAAERLLEHAGQDQRPVERRSAAASSLELLSRNAADCLASAQRTEAEVMTRRRPFESEPEAAPADEPSPPIDALLARAEERIARQEQDAKTSADVLAVQQQARKQASADKEAAETRRDAAQRALDAARRAEREAAEAWATNAACRTRLAEEAQRIQDRLAPVLQHHSGWEQHFRADATGLLAVLDQEVTDHERRHARAELLHTHLVELAQLRAVWDKDAGLAGDDCDALTDEELAAATLQSQEQVRSLVDADAATQLFEHCTLRLREARQRRATAADHERRQGDERARAQGLLIDIARRAGLATAHLGETAALVRTGDEAEAGAAPDPDLEQEYLYAQELLAELHRQQRETEGQIAVDDNHRRQRLDLEERITTCRAEQQCWQQLCNALGNRSGDDTFNVFAQQFTFRQVLLHANAHLCELAPRYRLEEVPGHPLELQVIDQDMGDEVRAAGTLSGGECFLVSLGLALGLASISSQQLRLETMFIDEGFGTLDPDTLDKALAALEGLRAQGRQIGLISHVSGLAERLGGEVRIHKLGGGCSALEVRGPDVAAMGV